MISATQRGGELERGIHVLTFQHQPGNTLFERRNFASLTREPAMIPALKRACASATTRAASFRSAAGADFGGQRFHFAGRPGDLVYGIYHGLVVVRHGEVVLRPGDIRVRIQQTAVKIGSVSPAVTPICCPDERNRSLRCNASCCKNAIKLMSG